MISFFFNFSIFGLFTSSCSAFNKRLREPVTSTTGAITTPHSSQLIAHASQRASSHNCCCHWNWDYGKIRGKAKHAYGFRVVFVSCVYANDTKACLRILLN